MSTDAYRRRRDLLGGGVIIIRRQREVTAARGENTAFVSSRVILLFSPLATRVVKRAWAHRATDGFFHGFGLEN